MKIDNLSKGMGQIKIGNFIKYVSFLMVLIFGGLFIVACGGSGAGGGVEGGGSNIPPAPLPSNANEYRGSYINRNNPSDSGPWKMIFTQNNKDFSGTVTVPSSSDESFDGSILNNAATIQTSNDNAVMIIDGNNLAATFQPNGQIYNISASLFSGQALQPVAGDVFSGGNPIAENPPPPTLPTTSTHSLVISNLTISPSSGPQNTQITFNITIDDINADVTKFCVRICSNDQYYYEYDISMSGQNPFTLSLPIIITNIAPGSIPIQVFVKDSAGNVSNYLNATFTVTDGAALDKIDTKEYWPLGDGNEYIFTNGGSIRIAERNFAPWITENFFKIDYFIDGTFQKSLFQAYDFSDFLLHYGGEFMNKSFYIITPSATQFPKEMEIGKTYYFKYQRQEYDTSGFSHGSGSEDIQISVMGPESVTTGAGNFITYKVKKVATWTDRWGMQGVDTEDFWLAKNIGVVKRFSQGITYELSKATVDGIKYP